MLRLPRIFIFFSITRGAQWLPSERFLLLSLHKTRSESPGAAPPQKRSDSLVFMRKSKKFSGDRRIIALDFDTQEHLRRFIKY